MTAPIPRVRLHPTLSPPIHLFHAYVLATPRCTHIMPPSGMILELTTQMRAHDWLHLPPSNCTHPKNRVMIATYSTFSSTHTHPNTNLTILNHPRILVLFPSNPPSTRSTLSLSVIRRPPGCHWKSIVVPCHPRKRGTQSDRGLRRTQSSLYYKHYYIHYEANLASDTYRVYVVYML